MDMTGIFGDPKKTREAFIDRELSRQAFQADRSAYQDELFDNTRHYVKPTVNDSTPAPAAEPQPLVIEQCELEALTKIVVQAREDSNGRSSDIFPADYDVRRVQNCRGCTYEHAKRLVDAVDSQRKHVGSSYAEAHHIAKAEAHHIAKAALESQLKGNGPHYRVFWSNVNGKTGEITNTPVSWATAGVVMQQGKQGPNVRYYTATALDEGDDRHFNLNKPAKSPGNVTVDALASILSTLTFTLPPDAARGIAENVFELLTVETRKQMLKGPNEQ